MNKWKKYGAAALAGALLIGVCVEGSSLHGTYLANAEETEETQRTTLNIVGDDDETEVSSDVTKTAADETENTEETAAETAQTDASDSEESERVTLNVAGSSDEDADSEAASSGEDGTEETAAEGDADSTGAAEEETDASVDEATLGAGSSVNSVETVSGSIVTTDVSEIVENCMPSIVSISCVSEAAEEDSSSGYYYYYADDGSIVFEDADEEEEEETTASGIIIAQSDTELLIATNYHVVSDADELMVGFSVEAEDEDDLTVYGRVKGTSSSTDLAVVAVELSDIEDSVLEQLRIANPGSSEDLKIGQATVAISNAMGYGVSATTGIISALNREVDIEGLTMEVILTDAAVNLGSSGGALLNASGEVIGICVAKETGDSAEGMGYFIPIDTAVPVLEQLINKETRDKLSDSERGYIGATVLTVSDEAIETYNMPAGAFVYEVNSGSAAEEAGLKNGDIITALEGESVTSSDDLIEKMSYYAPGETITLEVQTANNGSYEAREVEVTLQEGSSSTIASADSADDAEEETEESSSDRSGRSGLEIPDDEDGDEEDGSDRSRGGFDDGFEDGFEDYNSQFN
ncbi:MAG: trypsin-like peptidase domain-containing protein [Lachnospiraceae bacterium]|nr:trypsin-like peptidase domain-containing protein [Lachnospiraceae bacterium]